MSLLPQDRSEGVTIASAAAHETTGILVFSQIDFMAKLEPLVDGPTMTNTLSVSISFLSSGNRLCCVGLVVFNQYI